MPMLTESMKTLVWLGRKSRLDPEKLAAGVGEIAGQRPDERKLDISWNFLEEQPSVGILKPQPPAGMIEHADQIPGPQSRNTISALHHSLRWAGWQQAAGQIVPDFRCDRRPNANDIRTPGFEAELLVS
jgi:hypothetical protein